MPDVLLCLYFSLLTNPLHDDRVSLQCKYQNDSANARQGACKPENKI